MADDYTTIEAAKILGLAVRSIQMMVDRGELEAWKTQGGHRRISRQSLDRWVTARTTGNANTSVGAPIARLDATPRPATRKKILLIEDSHHFQRLITLLINDHFPAIDVHVADDGIVGMVLYGELQPDFLIVDILLPGIDGAVLIATLRTHEKFAHTRLVVVTALDREERTPFASAIGTIPVIEKINVAHELPKMLAEMLNRQEAAADHHVGESVLETTGVPRALPIRLPNG